MKKNTGNGKTKVIKPDTDEEMGLTPEIFLAPIDDDELNLTAAEKKPLNIAQTRFIVEYLKDGNAGKAAIRAGYAEVSAKEMGYALLKKPNIRYFFKRQFARTAERTRVTSDKVLAELAKIAFMNIGDLDFKNKTIKDMSMDDLACISKLTRTYTVEGDTIETIEFYDKTIALDKLGKHLKLFSEKSEPDTQIILNVTKAPDDIPRPPKKEEKEETPPNAPDAPDTLPEYSPDDDNDDLPEYDPNTPDNEEY